jgi:uncharacterized protein (TIGR03032 family)
MEEEKKLEITTSVGFGEWLKAHNGSLAFTTYQVGKILCVGTNPDASVHISERTFPRCMGLEVHENTLWMSSIFQMWRFENSLLPGQKFGEYDRVFIPQMAYTTGHLDIHDIVVTKDNKPVFVNTLFNCLGTISDTHSFKPLWKPPFITELKPEDRCHMNGLASRDGRPKYVTIVSKSNVVNGWRGDRDSGGMVMDIETNEVLCDGLSMPHSPRYVNGKIWLLNAGTGYFGYVDDSTKKFVPKTFCPGFLRGMTFVGDYAVVGISKNRENKTFEGMQLDENMKAAGKDPVCGLYIIDSKSGEVVHWLNVEGIIRELYDVKFLSDAVKPLLIGTMKEDIQRMVSIEPRA